MQDHALGVHGEPAHRDVAGFPRRGFGPAEQFARGLLDEGDAQACLFA